MQKYWLTNKNRKKLIIFFCGWGMDFHPFSFLKSSQYDVIAYYDFNELDSPENIWKEVDGYDEVNLVAWSMGVLVSNLLMKDFPNRLNIKLAINGTLQPIDDSYGIPTSIYEGTLGNFSEIVRDKFFKRMCGNREVMIRFGEAYPQREVKGQKQELIALQEFVNKEEVKENLFDFALIGENDLIFPTTNQTNFWQQAATKNMLINTPHFPFYMWDSWDDILEMAR